MAKKFIMTPRRKQNIIKAHKRMSTYIELGKKEYEKTHKGHKH